MSPAPVKWGDSDKRIEAPEAFIMFLREVLGLEDAEPKPYPDPAEVEIPPTALTDEDRTALSEIVGKDNVAADHDTRLKHSIGKSYLDLVRYCSGSLDRAPDAVIFPETAEQVAGILKWADETSRAVVPFGGGTSVVGGLEPTREGIALSMRRINRVVEVDQIAKTVRVEPGVTGPELEEKLEEFNLTLGHFPQSFEFSTVGGWIASRSAGQQSTLYGKIENLVIALRVITPSGEIQTLETPAEAMGPDIDQVFCGSEGTLGVIVEALLRTYPLPQKRIFSCGLFRDFKDGVETIRELMQEGLRPAIVRLYDQEETSAQGVMSGHPNNMSRRAKRWVANLRLRAQGMRPGSTCLLLLGFEGTHLHTQQQSQHADRIMAMHEGMPLGHIPGEHWFRTRFDLPYIRDDLFQRGAMVDTLETSATWGKLHELHQDLSAAIQTALEANSPGGMVLSHLSHAYPEGASLYFTFLARALKGEEETQWRQVQSAAMEVILRHGAAVSHHHGIGRLHSAYFTKQVGKIHMDILRSIKSATDPGGVMNPGKMGL